MDESIQRLLELLVSRNEGGKYPQRGLDCLEGVGPLCLEWMDSVPYPSLAVKKARQAIRIGLNCHPILGKSMVNKVIRELG